MNSSTSSFRTLTAVFFIAGAGTLALLIAASEWLVRAKVAPEDTLVKHVALFESTTSPYAAFGDSHVARGFDARAPVVNLAYPSENIEKMAWKAARYLKRAPHPEIVLIQADAHLFSLYRTEVGLDDYPRAFGAGPARGLLALGGRYRPQLIALWRAFLENGGRLASTIETTPQGALLSPGDLSQWRGVHIDQYTNDRVARHRPVPDFLNERSAALYKKMVLDFAASGARVCLASLPTSPAYRSRIEALPPADRKLWDEAEAFFKSLAEHPNVRFIDHRARYDDLSLFRDPDHLNRQGAMAYGPVLQKACFGDVKNDMATTAVAQAGD